MATQLAVVKHNFPTFTGQVIESPWQKYYVLFDPNASFSKGDDLIHGTWSFISMNRKGKRRYHPATSYFATKEEVEQHVESLIMGTPVADPRKYYEFVIKDNTGTEQIIFAKSSLGIADALKTAVRNYCDQNDLDPDNFYFDMVSVTN